MATDGGIVDNSVLAFHMHHQQREHFNMESAVRCVTFLIIKQKKKMCPKALHFEILSKIKCLGIVIGPQMN